ncbi:glycosyltransferase [Paraburkholderia silvatlantica]|uniref:glycosyltransferase n=1 Tax=Paraburkholderia silvatlantica TaxID=321895 RepID=UPI0037518F40
MKEIERSLATLQANANRTAALCEIQRLQLSAATETICSLDLASRTSALNASKRKFCFPEMWSARERRYLRTLRGSRLFDVGFYLTQYSHVAAEGVDPVLHYIRAGAKEGCDPHPLFSTSWYLECYADVAASGMNPLIHFIEFGRNEKRIPHPLFDSAYYLSKYPDVNREGINPLLHYVLHGGKEGRSTHRLFDGAVYGKVFPGVEQLSITPLEHYCLYGYLLNTMLTPYFDPVYYASKVAEVAEQRANPALHYVKTGAKKGLKPVGVFTDASKRVRLPDSGALRRSAEPKLPAATGFAKRVDLPASASQEPLISVLLPVYNGNLEHLSDAIKSVQQQAYGNWELIVVDDKSSNPACRKLISEIQAMDSRITFHQNSETEGAFLASRRAAELARGEFVCILDQDDMLESSALSVAAHRVSWDKTLDLVYSDHAIISEKGRLLAPGISAKADCKTDALIHFKVIRRDVFVRLEETSFSSFSPLSKDLISKLLYNQARAVYLPEPLYLWRMHVQVA